MSYCHCAPSASLEPPTSHTHVFVNCEDKRKESLAEMAERNREDVEGYIYEVSEVKTPSSGNRYFDFKIQARDVNRRIVCFSPDKRQDIKENEEKKSPVKIYNVLPKRHKFDPENIEYIMNNKIEGHQNQEYFVSME